MKLIVQSDDFGMTKAVSLGCIEAIKNGIVRNTGMFTNMPDIDECFELIKPYLEQIALGIDLNITTGTSVLSHEFIPSLTKENGDYYTSKENRAMDNEENHFDHLKECRDQVYAEFKAQIEKYIEIVGHKPDYIHNHAYWTPTIEEVTLALAKEYGVLSTMSMHSIEEVKESSMGWYVYGDAQKQLKSTPLEYITNDTDCLLDSEYGYIVSHCGYVDIRLFELSSFNTCRVNDLAAMIDSKMKQWIKNNHIELITFKDLPKEWI